MAINIVLYEPEIPYNTGNIARTCAVTGSRLHLIKPLGFSVEDKYLKRAGLDYWDLLDIHYYENYKDFIDKNNIKNIYYLTTKGGKWYTEANYTDEVYLVFGKETAGLPRDILEENYDKCLRIPMIAIEKARSLNLSNAVAIVVYEALRQLGFPKCI